MSDAAVYTSDVVTTLAMILIIEHRESLTTQLVQWQLLGFSDAAI